jgi:hypothetical protein
VRHPALTGAGFHILLQGSCRLTPEGSTRQPSARKTSSSFRTAAPMPPSDGSPGQPPDSPPAPLAGLRDEIVPGSSVVMLCGAYLLDGAQPHPCSANCPRSSTCRLRAGQHPGCAASSTPQRRAHPSPTGDGRHRPRAARRAAGLPDPQLPRAGTRPSPRHRLERRTHRPAITAALNRMRRPGTALDSRRPGRRGPVPLGVRQAVHHPHRPARRWPTWAGGG